MLFLTSKDFNLASLLKETDHFYVTTGYSTTKIYSEQHYTTNDLPFMKRCNWLRFHDKVPLFLYSIKTMIESLQIGIAIQDEQFHPTIQNPISTQLTRETDLTILSPASHTPTSVSNNNNNAVSYNTSDDVPDLID
jgi:hypothetical protein